MRKLLWNIWHFITYWFNPKWIIEARNDLIKRMELVNALYGPKEVTYKDAYYQRFSYIPYSEHRAYEYWLNQLEEAAKTLSKCGLTAEEFARLPKYYQYQTLSCEEWWIENVLQESKEDWVWT